MLYSGGKRLPEQEVNSGTPVIEDIHYENISCKYSKQNVIQIIGLPEMPVNNVTFKNINLGGRIGIDVKDAKNITFENVKISNEVWSPVSVSFSDDITINNLNIAETAPEKLPMQLHDIHHVKVSKLKYLSKKEMVKITGKANHLKFDKSIPKTKIINETK